MKRGMIVVFLVVAACGGSGAEPFGGGDRPGTGGSKGSGGEGGTAGAGGQGGTCLGPSGNYTATETNTTGLSCGGGDPVPEQPVTMAIGAGTYPIPAEATCDQHLDVKGTGLLPIQGQITWTPDGHRGEGDLIEDWTMSAIPECGKLPIHIVLVHQ